MSRAITQQNGPQTPVMANGNGNRMVDDSPQALRLKTLMERSIDKLEAALPKYLTPERVIQVVTTINYRTPDLQKCDPVSILTSVIQGASLGLDFAPTTGEAYLIPRWNNKIKGLECTFMPGYRGLAKLARNGGTKYVRAELVYEKDTFVYQYTPDLEFLHKPYLGHDRGSATHVYAIAKTASDEHLVMVMTDEEIEAIHKRSEGYKRAVKNKESEVGPWVTDRNEMMKKTPLKRLCKMLPMSSELAAAIEADNTEYETWTEENQGRTQVSRRGTVGLSQQLGIAHEEEKPLPPQPSTVYSEAEESTDQVDDLERNE